MNIAMFTGFGKNIPFEQEIAMIKKAGFDIIALDGNLSSPVSYASPEGLKIIQKAIRQSGLSVDSVHAPFPEGDRLFSINENERMESFAKCRLAIKAASELDGKIVVIHLIPYGIPEGGIRRQMIKQGLKSVSSLLEYSSAHNVKLALENGQKKDYDMVLAHFLAEFDTPSVGFCYDSGHENVQGKCFDILEKFGNRLLTTHLHDNLGQDTHMLPGEGSIDWERFVKVIHGIDYHGNLLLESSMAFSEYREAEEFLSEARKRAGKLFALTNSPGAPKIK